MFHFLTMILTVASVSARIIDLSHDHGPDTIMSPHVPKFNRSTIFAADYVPGVYVEGGKYFSGEHGGTHLDAPVHFMKGGMRLHEIPIENTIAEGVMIDCAKEASKNSSYTVPLQKLLDWEAENGPIPMEAAVIFNFGWSSRFKDKKMYLGTDNDDDQFSFVFPSVGEEAGLWLYDQRYIKIIASDTLSPDAFSVPDKTKIFPIHRKLLPNNRLIIENLKGSDQLPARGFRFHAAPVKYVGSTGAQVRAYAVTYERDVNNGGLKLQITLNGLSYIIFSLCAMYTYFK